MENAQGLAFHDMDLFHQSPIQLHVFIERHDHRLFRIFASMQGVDLDTPCPRTGMTALMTACIYRWEYAVSFLLNSRRVWVNRIDSMGRTALHFAEHASIVRLLKNANADVNSRSYDGGTALHKAAKIGNHPVTSQSLLKSIDQLISGFFCVDAKS